jgi:hypothetical protein
MRPIGVLTLVVGAALVILLGPPVGAQPGDDKGLSKCLRQITFEPGARCVKSGDDWKPSGGGLSANDPEGLFGTFVFVGLLLSLLPAFVGAAISKDAGVSGAAGFGIGLVASWVGVIGLYLYGHSQRQGRPLITSGPATAPATREGMGPAVGGTTEGPPESNAPADRLRALRDLRDQGLITQEEYEERRSATLDSL